MSWIARSAPHAPQRREEVSNRARPRRKTTKRACFARGRRDVRGREGPRRAVACDVHRHSARRSASAPFLSARIKEETRCQEWNRTSPGHKGGWGSRFRAHQACLLRRRRASRFPFMSRPGRSRSAPMGRSAFEVRASRPSTSSSWSERAASSSPRRRPPPPSSSSAITAPNAIKRPPRAGSKFICRATSTSAR